MHSPLLYWYRTFLKLPQEVSLYCGRATNLLCGVSRHLQRTKPYKQMRVDTFRLIPYPNMLLQYVLEIYNFGSIRNIFWPGTLLLIDYLFPCVQRYNRVNIVEISITMTGKTRCNAPPLLLACTNFSIENPLPFQSNQRKITNFLDCKCTATQNPTKITKPLQILKRQVLGIRIRPINQVPRMRKTTTFGNTHWHLCSNSFNTNLIPIGLYLSSILY